MQVLILEDEFLALLHVLSLEKVIELNLYILHNTLNPTFNLLAGILTSLLNLFLKVEHLNHEVVVLNLSRVLNLDPSQLHHVSSPFQVI